MLSYKTVEKEMMEVSWTIKISKVLGTTKLVQMLKLSFLKGERESVLKASLTFNETS